MNYYVITGRADGMDEDVAVTFPCVDTREAEQAFIDHMKDVYGDVVEIYVNYIIECGEDQPTIKRMP